MFFTKWKCYLQSLVISDSSVYSKIFLFFVSIFFQYRSVLEVAGACICVHSFNSVGDSRHSLDCQCFTVLCHGAEGFLFVLSCYSILNSRLSNLIFFCTMVDRKYQRGLFLMSFFLPCGLPIPSVITGKKYWFNLFLGVSFTLSKCIVLGCSFPQSHVVVSVLVFLCQLSRNLFFQCIWYVFAFTDSLWTPAKKWMFRRGTQWVKECLNIGAHYCSFVSIFPFSSWSSTCRMEPRSICVFTS